VAGLSSQFSDTTLVLVELYVLLRSPAVLAKPLAPAAALDIVRRLRGHPRWAVLDYPGNMMDAVWEVAEARDFP